VKPRLPVKVRCAELKDLDFCLASDLDHVDAYRGERFMQEYLRRKIEASDVVVAEADRKLVGYLRIEYLGLIAPYLGIIGVDDAYQRKGIGTAMIEFLEQHLLTRRNRKTFTLDGIPVLHSSAESQAIDSQRWHRAVGFEECGILAGANEGGIGEVFFRKPLKPRPSQPGLG
jgi:GNAT superfamily N-acetyltransferase